MPRPSHSSTCCPAIRRWSAIGIGGREPGDAKDTGNNIRRNQQFVVNLVDYANAPRR